MTQKKNIVSGLEEMIKKREMAVKKEEANSALNQANEFYNKMVNDGVIKKRGYTLRGIDDSHLYFSSI